MLFYLFIHSAWDDIIIDLEHEQGVEEMNRVLEVENKIVPSFKPLYDQGLENFYDEVNSLSSKG